MNIKTTMIIAGTKIGSKLSGLATVGTPFNKKWTSSPYNSGSKKVNTKMLISAVHATQNEF